MCLLLHDESTDRPLTQSPPYRFPITLYSLSLSNVHMSGAESYYPERLTRFDPMIYLQGVEYLHGQVAMTLFGTLKLP